MNQVRLLGDHGRWLLIPIMGLLLLGLAACGPEEGEVPTAVPAVSMPENNDSNLPDNDSQTEGDTTTEMPAESEPGERVLLPSLAGAGSVAQGLGGGGAANAVPAAPEAELGAASSIAMIHADPFSATVFSLNTTLPAQPVEAAVFQYQQPTDVSLEYAQTMANRFGFNGELYTENFTFQEQVEIDGQPFVPPTIYYAFDGSRIFTIDAWSANYQNEDAVYDFENQLDFATASQVAESFLQERGLLDFPYTMQDGFGSDIFFMRQIDGRTINQPEIMVGVSQDGDVSYVSYQVMTDLQNLGTYPLISAEAAWALIQSGVSENNIPYGLNPTGGEAPIPVDGPPSEDYQSWPRVYQPGEAVNLFGWPTAYLPTSGNGDARVQIYPFTLTGEGDIINQIAENGGQQITVEGVIGDDGETVIVSDWASAAEVEPTFLQGVIQRQGEQVSIVANSGDTYILPNVPADVPDGLEVTIFAWSSQETGEAYPVLQWQSIDKVIEFPEEPIASEPLPVDPAVVEADFGYESVSIESVELSYYYSYQYPGIDEEQASDQIRISGPPTIMLQPIWKFIGTADDGTAVEFYVQAADPEFIQE